MINSRFAETALIGAFAINIVNVGVFQNPNSHLLLLILFGVGVCWRAYVAWANLQTIAAAGAWMVGHAFHEHYPTRFKWYLNLFLDTWAMVLVMFIASAYLVDWLFWPSVAACLITAFPIGGFAFCWELYEQTVAEAQAEIEAENEK